MQMEPTKGPGLQEPAGLTPEAVPAPPQGLDRVDQPGAEGAQAGAGATGQEVKLGDLSQSDAGPPAPPTLETAAATAPPVEASSPPEPVAEQPPPAEMPVSPDTAIPPPGTATETTETEIPVDGAHAAADAAQQATEGHLGTELKAAGVKQGDGQNEMSPAPPAGPLAPQEITAAGATAPAVSNGQEITRNPIPSGIEGGAEAGGINSPEAWRTSEAQELVRTIGELKSQLEELRAVASKNLEGLGELQDRFDEALDGLKKLVETGQASSGSEPPEQIQQTGQAA